MKNLYTQIVNTESQKSHPFGLAEKRFAWVEIYSNGNDLVNHKKLFTKNKDNLEGGIGHYFQRIQSENEKEREREINMLKYNLENKNQKKMKYKYQNLNSQRVIYPEKDKKKKKIIKKKTYENTKKSLLYLTSGSISSLFMRTPAVLKNKGKRIINNSVDYGRKRDTDLFSDSFLNNKEYNRIPGVARKCLVQRIDYHGKPLEDIKQGRKHFKIN